MPSAVTIDELFARFDSWHEEARLCKTIPYANAMTLSTVNAQGAPSSRIVLLKGRDAQGFTFFTNMNSRKAQEIRGNQAVALCFYWGELGKQVRVEGRAEPASEAESDAYFATRPRESQLGAWASLQSTPMDSHADLKNRFAEVTKHYQGQDVPRPPHWGGWRVIPTRIEFWEEGAHRLHKRNVYSRTAQGWTQEILYP